MPVVRLDPELPLPSYARAGDAGADLVAAEDVLLRRAGGRARRQRPLWPNPPVPRSEPSSASTAAKLACSTRWITSWAMRSPRCTW